MIRYIPIKALGNVYMALRQREEYEWLFSSLRQLYPDVDLPIIKADDSLELIDC